MELEVEILGTPEEIKRIMEGLTTRLHFRGVLLSFDPNYYPLDRGKFTIDIKPKDGDKWIKNWITVKKISDDLSLLKLEVKEDDWQRVKDVWDILKKEFIRHGILKETDTYKPSRKVLIEQACIGWASRGYVPKFNKDEFLSEFNMRNNIFLTKADFNRALQDAEKKGLIVKIEGRFRNKPDP